MFAVGEVVIYGSSGACRVLDICTPDSPGKPRESYVLQPLYEINTKIYAPIDGTAVTMRSVLTKGQAQQLVDSLPSITAYPASMSKEALQETYKAAIKSADSAELAKLIKTLYEKKQRLREQRKNMASAERDYFDKAERNLHGELAVALDIPYDAVVDHISFATGEGTSS